MVVFQDFLSKWPMVYLVKDQKASTLVWLLVNEVIPVIGVPESLLRDQPSLIPHEGCVSTVGHKEN